LSSFEFQGDAKKCQCSSQGQGHKKLALVRRFEANAWLRGLHNWFADSC